MRKLRPSLRWEPLMLTALILVCSIATGPDLRGCTRDNALDVLQVPKHSPAPSPA